MANTRRQVTAWTSLVTAAKALLVLVFLPPYLASRLATARLTLPQTWERDNLLRNCLLCSVVAIAVFPASAFALIEIAQAGELLSLRLVCVGLLASWSLAIPVVPLAWWATVARTATHLDTGIFDRLKDAGAIRRAIWAGTSREAARRAQVAGLWAQNPHLGEESLCAVVGAVYRDPRDPLRKLKAPMPRGEWLDVSKKRVCLPPTLGFRCAALGASGCGKSSLFRAFVSATLLERGSVLYVNAKGDRETASDLKQLAAQKGVPFREWNLDGDAPFDAWRGDAEAIISKVVGLLGVPTSDASAFYRSKTLAVLREISSCRAHSWTSSVELLADLREHRSRDISRADLARVRVDIVRALAGIENAIDGRDHEAGWCWEDLNDSQIILVTVSPASDAARNAALLMLLDLVAFKEDPHRQGGPPGFRRVLILDEAAVLLNAAVIPPISVLSEQLRSAQIDLCVGSQSFASLGPPDEAARLLDSGCTIIAGRLPNPEEICRRAGTVQRVEMGHQADQKNDQTGLYSQRLQSQFALDPDRLRSGLPPGHFALIDNGAVVFFATPRRSESSLHAPRGPRTQP